MFKLFLALNFLLLNLFACKGGYDSCKQKIIDSNSIHNQTLQIPISKNQRLVFSTNKPDAKIIKHDPFLNLYIVEDTKPFKYPFVINKNSAMGIASVDEKKAVEGKIVEKQIGLNTLATFSEPIQKNALLLNSCCAFEGIVTPRGIIQKEFIDKFLKSNNRYYGDIGVRVEDKKDLIFIKRVNPFIKDNPFKPADKIVTLDGKKVQDSSAFMQNIIFSKIGTIHNIKVKRDSKYLNFKVKTQKRYGGGYISDTFLEQIGLYFSENLTMLRVEKEFDGYGLKIGDRLLQVNAKKVKNQQDIMKYLIDFQSPCVLLFERDGFQFFVHVD